MSNSVQLVSSNVSGVEGNNLSFDPSISADGSKVAFDSWSTNLVNGTSGLFPEIYVKNVKTGAVTLVSQTSTGVIANDTSLEPAISADGSSVVFESVATNLGVAAGTQEIYVKNLNNGALTLVSSSSAKVAADGNSVQSAISANGTLVAFQSGANNLLAGVSGDQVYLKNVTSGAVTLVSGANGTAGNDLSGSPSISDDGTKVAFTSDSTNLVTGATSGDDEIYLKNTSTGAVTLVSKTNTGVIADASNEMPSISADGNTVAFESTATNLGLGASGQFQEIYVKNLQTGTLTLASTTATGAIANGDCSNESLSADGRYVVFQSVATNLIPGVTGAQTYLKDLQTGALTLLSANADGTPGSNDSDDSRAGSGRMVSGDDTTFVFDSSATNLLSTGPTDGEQVFSARAASVRNDFNDDRKSDILLQNTNGTPQVWLMNGTSVTSMTSLANPGSSWHVMASGDFNLDEKADVVLQSTDGLPKIWLMNGASITSTVTLPNPGPSWHTIATGDFDADGRTDILWQNTDGLPAIWKMNGTSIVAGVVLPNPGPSWHAIGAGDFNSDGKADILWQNTDGLPAIWEMNGGSIIGAGVLPNPGPTWHAIGVGDFNGDGHADILWQNNDGLPAIWEMNGTSIINAAVLANPGPSWHAIGTSDFNGDGKADIIWQNNDGLPAIWEMNGTSISVAKTLSNPGSAWQIKDDGPIAADQMATAMAAGPSSTAPAALRLSAPDLTPAAGSILHGS